MRQGHWINRELTSLTYYRKPLHWPHPWPLHWGGSSSPCPATPHQLQERQCLEQRLRQQERQSSFPVLPRKPCEHWRFTTCAEDVGRTTLGGGISRKGALGRFGKNPQNSTSHVATSSLTRNHSDCHPRACLPRAAREASGGQVLVGRSTGWTNPGREAVTDQGVKSEKKLYRTRAFACGHLAQLLQVLVGRGDEGGRGRKGKASYYFSSLCQKQTRKTQKYPVPGVSSVPQRRPRGDSEGGPARPLPLTGAGGQHCLPAGPCPRSPHDQGYWRERGPGISASPELYLARSEPASASCPVCASHRAELSLLEKHRELFLVLLSTVHVIRLLTGPYLFFLVAFQAGDHFNTLHHNRI